MAISFGARKILRNPFFEFSSDSEALFVRPLGKISFIRKEKRTCRGRDPYRKFLVNA
ncbi:hypothetical protein LEP1GSC050_4266 [Leptospira broomii serovar Hurstbridge str. 5399]|uniref:Uncharacterized protein n=1 Tax=Leptospira broomii serovar Hurstbridge str. 5399 TaxID=1049789 RepID=T0GBW4_9LEPT|nr:hypothetical protein LEP1GSC050_4266 [Leptospira broomii serovar Hurstbridge str. 5399]